MKCSIAEQNEAIIRTFIIIIIITKDFIKDILRLLAGSFYYYYYKGLDILRLLVLNLYSEECTEPAVSISFRDIFDFPTSFKSIVPFKNKYNRNGNIYSPSSLLFLQPIGFSNLTS